MNRILVLMLSISTIALASDAGDAGTDIVQRTVNFVLFAGLVWYLVAEPAKAYFASRSQAIADDLKKVQDRLNESIVLKKKALTKISDAEKFAEELAVSSKKENKIVNDNIMLQCEADLEAIAKQHASATAFDQRNMVRNVVKEIVEETLSQAGSSFDKEAMANIILKRVA